MFVEPALASLADVAPSGPGWLHEIKFDGYRLRIDGSKVKLLTRKASTLVRTFSRDPAEPLHGCQPAGQIATPRLRSLGRYRLREAVAGADCDCCDCHKPALISP